VKAANLKVEKHDANILEQGTADYSIDRKGGADFKYFYLDNHWEIDPALKKQINDPRGFIHVVSPQKEQNQEEYPCFRIRSTYFFH